MTTKANEGQVSVVKAHIYDQFTVEPGYGPTINMDWDGKAVIIWEEGPHEWTYTFRYPGTNVWTEPVNTAVLAVWRER